MTFPLWHLHDTTNLNGINYESLHVCEVGLRQRGRETETGGGREKGRERKLDGASEWERQRKRKRP